MPSKTVSLFFATLMLFATGCLMPPAEKGAVARIAPPEKIPDAPVPATTGSFDSGEYRNLFVERGLRKSDVAAKVEAAYQQLFHGNENNEAVLFAAGQNDNGPMAYIMDIASNDIRSEGMSYGMMIAVQLDKKADFDAIWNWSRTYMYHEDEAHPDHGYFSWQMRDDGTAIDVNPAPDGEEYFIMALYFAAHRWGNGEGIYNYKQWADTILSDVKNREDITGTVNDDPDTTITALFHPDEAQVRFTPNTKNFVSNGDHTDPSYHLPAFYELWALWGPEEDRAFWKKAAQVSRDFFVECTHPETGLNPDYANFDGTPKAASWNPKTVDFGYDAFRTAMNWAMDWAWWAKDKRQIELSDRLQKFFEGQRIYSYGATFTLSGTPTAEHHSSALAAMNAVASLSASDQRAWLFVDELWEMAVPTGKWRYYEGLLYMFGLLHVSGNYQIYAPAP